MITHEEKDPFEVESERAYAIYDSESGAIVHAHVITTFRGGEELPRDQHETRALSMARLMGHETEKLRVLEVDPAELETGNKRVDLATRTLVPDSTRKEDDPKSHRREPVNREL